MGIVALEEIRPGMILASDLRTRQGRLLLPKQSVITHNHLRMARIWGITEADIEDIDNDQPAKTIFDDLESEKRQLFEEITAWRFANCDLMLPPMRRLADLFVRRLDNLAQTMSMDAMRNLYFGQPLSPDQVAKILSPTAEHVLSCEDMLRREPILACLPEIFYEIIEVVENPKTSAAFLAEIIGKDQALSSKLLRLVNSAFYGFENKVETLERAVVIVGQVQIANLAMGVTVTSVFKGIPPEIMDMHAFWEHNIAVGVISRLLGMHRRVPVRERLFVAGLLHDLGRLVVFKNYLPQAKSLLSLATTSAKPLFELEKEVWGFTHADLGGLLLQKWRIPQTIQHGVAQHHPPFSSSASDEAKLVYLADIIAYSLGFGHTGLNRVPPLCLKTWEQSGLPVSVLTSVAAQMENQLRDLMRLFLAD